MKAITTKRSLLEFVEQELGDVAYFLIYALLEWTLIILLFINALLVFFANEFARFFELKTPCSQCTRAVFMNMDLDFYNESICDSHQKEVSSLAFCHAHMKLSYSKKMCEKCLLSFATERESDCETYKSLVGILHKDMEMFLDDDQELNLSLPVGNKKQLDGCFTHEKMNSSSEHLCSCCGAPLKAAAYNARGRRGGFFSSTPALSPRSPRSSSKNDDNMNMSLPGFKFSKPKIGDRDSENQGTILGKQDEEDKNLNLIKGNMFFGIPLTDSAPNSPRWSLKASKTSDYAELIMRNEGASDNESMFHQWKKQVKLDRRSLIELYMELDEERSASAVAANNAMAMITRLQTEKAALQMEALQYQRMVEEQAEYDEEAFQEMNEYISRRDEEIRDLEAELDAYREKYGCLEEDWIIAQEGEEETCKSS